MDFEFLYVSARIAVIEIKNFGIFNTDKEVSVYCNDELSLNTNRVVTSIYELNPDTDYTFQLKCDNRCSTKKVIHTPKEFCTLNVKDFGAKGDGNHDDTVSIQCAIAACPKNSRVLIPAGVYKITSLFLKSDIKIELAKGAALLAQTDRNKFSLLPGMIKSYDGMDEYNIGTWEGEPLTCFSSIINGFNVENVEIYGEGTLDGAAGHNNWWNQPKVKNIAWRPRMIFLNHCKNIILQGITVGNSPSWNIHPYFSENLKFIDLKVINPQDSPNTDGLNPESCKNVEITGAYFSVGDDCIAIKSGKIYMGSKYKTPSENLVIRQCCMRDGHGSVTIGSEMAGGVKNLIVKECLFLHTDRGLRIKTRRGRGKYAVVDGILFENIRMDHVMTPVVINSYYFCDIDGHSEYVQSKEFHPVDDRTPYLGEFLFRNISCTNCHAAAAYMYGLPEQKIKKVSFENVNFSYADQPAAGVPAMMDGAPATKRLGIFADNIETLSLKDVVVNGQEGAAYIFRHIDNLDRR